MNQYPDGDVNVNMLPTMSGTEYVRAGSDADRIMRARAGAYLRWLRREYRFPYALRHFFPVHGVRESWRLDGRYVLRESDLRAGLYAQPLSDRLVAYADHMIDVHGTSAVKKKLPAALAQPYGVPYDCLLPKEYDNLLVAGHAASFSHIAAASVRLSRTMIALGEAAGYAAALAVQGGTAPEAVPMDALRERCRTADCEALIRQLWS